MNPALSEIRPSASLKMAALAQQLRQQGRDVVSLALGDSHFSPAPKVVQSIEQALRTGKTHYGNPQGLLKLREQIATTLPGSAWTSDSILIVPGLKQGLYYLMNAIRPRRVAVIEPAWLGYRATATLCEAEYAPVNRRQQNWLQKVEDNDFEMLVVCSPNNPDGAILSQSESESLIKICTTKNAWLVADEIYSGFNYTGTWQSFATLTNYSRLVICNGFSKSHAMTGLRIGWMAIQEKELLQACLQLQQHIATCANVPAQHGLAEALASSENTVIDCNYYLKNRDRVEERLPGLSKYCPDGGFYYFFPVEALLQNCEFDFAEQLLQQSAVAVVPGSAYGDNFKQWIRLSFSVSHDELAEGLRRIQEFIEGRT